MLDKHVGEMQSELQDSAAGVQDEVYVEKHGKLPIKRELKKRLRRCTKGYYIKQPNMDCQPTEFTALSRHRAVFSWAGKGGIPIRGA